MSTSDAIFLGIGALIIVVVMYNVFRGPRPTERGGPDAYHDGGIDAVD